MKTWFIVLAVLMGSVAKANYQYECQGAGAAGPAVEISLHEMFSYEDDQVVAHWNPADLSQAPTTTSQLIFNFNPVDTVTCEVGGETFSKASLTIDDSRNLFVDYFFNEKVSWVILKAGSQSARLDCVYTGQR